MYTKPNKRTTEVD